MVVLAQIHIQLMQVRLLLEQVVITLVAEVVENITQQQQEQAVQAVVVRLELTLLV
jgi:hypothetical protein